jgi:hypothetical protein
MKRQRNYKYIFLIVYITIIIGIYSALVYPIIPEPKELTPTIIPSLSVSGIKDVNILFNNYGKTWTQYPSKPDLSNYTFSGKDPL